MRTPPGTSLKEAVAVLERHYGSPAPPPTSDPFELVLWENVAYLASGARRLDAFEQLRKTVGTSPDSIRRAGRTALEAVTSRGILKGTFAAKLRECARIASEECGGDVAAALRRDPGRAKRMLRTFPGIGEPGADKILLFSGLGAELAPESNGLRVLVRLGLVPDRGLVRADVRGKPGGRRPVARGPAIETTGAPAPPRARPDSLHAAPPELRGLSAALGLCFRARRVTRRGKTERREEEVCAMTVGRWNESPRDGREHEALVETGCFVRAR